MGKVNKNLNEKQRPQNNLFFSQKYIVFIFGATFHEIKEKQKVLVLFWVLFTFMYSTHDVVYISVCLWMLSSI